MDEQNKFLHDYIEHLKHIKKFSPNTIRAYKQDIGQFLNYFQENKLNIKKETIRDFISTIFLKTKNKSTISRKIYAIKSYFFYLKELGEIEKNPFDLISIPKVDKRMPQILTEKEMIEFLDSIPEDTLLHLRNKTVFELLYATGLRISELVNLKTSDIDFGEGLLRVMGKGKKERIVPFNDHAKEILLKYLAEAKKKFNKKIEYIFLNSRGTKITERSIERILQNTYRNIIRTNKKIYPHLFRHSFATHLLQRGANLRIIQELLGHSNLSTTEKYTNLNYSDLLKVYKKFHPRSS